MNMPEPMMPPITIIVASNNPRLRASFGVDAPALAALGDRD
jgi:hypothetical protein